MAFQSNIPFAKFLRGNARSPSLDISAPAVNFLLEERLPASREQDLLAKGNDPAATTWSNDAFLLAYGNHYNDKLALPPRRATEISTFAAENRENHLSLESNLDVVRLESLHELYRLCQGDFGSLSDLERELHNLVESRQPGKARLLDTNRRSLLLTWLEGLNKIRDARPAFVAPFSEVKQLLAAPDWATQLRNVLGLAHLGGSKTRPLSVLLCRYNLTHVERAARKAKIAAWAATPTVLDAGGPNGPGVAFFPFPKAATGNQLGYGATVNLAPDGNLDFNSEFLHFRLEYTLEHFERVGALTDAVSEAQIATARRQHFDLLEQDYLYRADLLRP